LQFSGYKHIDAHHEDKVKQSICSKHRAYRLFIDGCNTCSTLFWNWFGLCLMSVGKILRSTWIAKYPGLMRQKFQKNLQQALQVWQTGVLMGVWRPPWG